MQGLLRKKTFWFPPPLTDFTDMVLKLTVLVKVICNANSHDFTYWSVNRDRFVQLHFPWFTFNLDYSWNQTLAEPILHFSLSILQSSFSIWWSPEQQTVFPNIHQREQQALSCVETLTSYLSACRLPVHVVINPRLRSQSQVAAADCHGNRSYYSPFPISQSILFHLQIGSL